MQALELILDDCKAVFLGENKKGEKHFSRTVVISGVCIEREIFHAILKVACRASGALSTVESQFKVVEGFVSNFTAFFSRPASSYPESSLDWMLALHNFLRFVLTDPKTQKQLSTRKNVWNYQICKILRLMRDDELIPIDVEIPVIPQNKQRNKHKDQTLLGRKKQETVKSSASVNKLLISIDYARGDADYLDFINEECVLRASKLKEVCLSYFANLKHDHQMGRKLAAVITDEDIADALTNGTYVRRSGKAKSNKTVLPKVTNQKIFEDGYIWALARIRYLMMSSSADPACVSTKALSEDDFYCSGTPQVSSCLRLYGNALRSHSAYSEKQYSLLVKSGVIYRFAGVLTNLDMIVLSCILIHEHPKINPDSILNAELYNKHGKTYFTIGDSKEPEIFSVDKPRAHERKITVLTPLAKEVLEFIVSSTTPIRRMLKASGNKQWRLLFLGLQLGNNLGPLKGKASAHLIGDHKGSVSLTKLYPELLDHNLKAGTLSLSALRNTMGVIKWFQTGSVREMARVLGNTYRVVLEHYIPPSLLSAWNNRLIRRFQQTLIVLAAYDEDYLLDVSDFSTMSDLTRFMVQMFFNSKPGSNPVDTVIHEKLVGRFAFIYGGSGPQSRRADAQFNLRLDPRTLAILYCYVEVAEKLPSNQRKRIDPTTNVSPQHFVNLTRMIIHVCEADKEEGFSDNSYDMESLRECHKQAIAQQDDIRKSFSGFSLHQEWSA